MRTLHLHTFHLCTMFFKRSEEHSHPKEIGKEEVLITKENLRKRARETCTHVCDTPLPMYLNFPQAMMNSWIVVFHCHMDVIAI